MIPGLMRLWAAKTGVPYEWLREGVWPQTEKPAKKSPAKAPGRPKAVKRTNGRASARK